MKNKKIVLALSLVLALGATLMVGGSLAWFSDTDEATNTFTVGSVEIEQVEDFVQNSELIPVGSNDTPNDDENFINKEVSVKNTGKNPAYVQTFVAVPAVLDLSSGPLRLHAVSTDWTALGRVASNVAITFDNDGTDLTQNFNVYAYRYNAALAAGNETSDALSGVYIDEKTDIQVNRNASDSNVIDSAYLMWDTNDDGVKEVLNGFNLVESNNMKLHVLVATQAVQSQGFASASEALNAAFPNHPWKNN